MNESQRGSNWTCAFESQRRRADDPQVALRVWTLLEERVHVFSLHVSTGACNSVPVEVELPSPRKDDRKRLGSLYSLRFELWHA